MTTERSLLATAERLGEDRAAYVRLFSRIVPRWTDFEPVVLGPFLPRPNRLLYAIDLSVMRAGLSCAMGLAMRFRPDRARALLAGHAAHSMLCGWETRPSGGVGLFLIAAAHVFGWGFPRGGSRASRTRWRTVFKSSAARSARADHVDELPKADVVLADVVPRELLPHRGRPPPGAVCEALRRYRYGPGVFKLDWALDGPIPWAADDCRRAATVHLGGTFDELADSERDPWERRHAERPFVLLLTHHLTLRRLARPRRQNKTAWAYCHVPNGSTEDMTERMEAQVERFAPGFRDLVLARFATAPADFELRNPNIVGGDINGGAMDLGQLFFRPVRRLVPYRTPLEALYICSSATPPGGGVHGMCGYSAALVALRDHDGSLPHS